MKIKQTIPFFLTILGIALEYFFYWCVYSVDVCRGSLFYQSFDFIKPLYLFSLTILPLGVILIFMQEKVFKSWLKFAVWWIPLSALFITLTPVTSNSWMPLYEIVRDDVAWFFGILFLCISVSRIFAQVIELKYFKSTWNKVFYSWLFFAVWWGVFSMFLIGLSFSPDTIRPPLSFFPSQWLSLVLGVLFAVISLGIIAWKAFALRKKNSG